MGFRCKTKYVINSVFLRRDYTSVLGGGITYLSFKPCCDKLKETLQNTMLHNPDYQPTKEDDDLVILDAAITDEIED